MAMQSVTITPVGQNALINIFEWLDACLIGSVATIASVLALAYVGFLMLSGRVDIRRAAQVVFGCFVIFGASTIASGIRAALPGAELGSGAIPDVPADPEDALPAATNQEMPPRSYDPYAGAAVGKR